MSKEMISIPVGNLMRVAAIKSITTISDLKERTSVDRKTLSAINTGKPVKRATLQSIANKLRIPIEHLLASNAVNNNDDANSNEPQYREIKLQKLDGASLRELASETDERDWFLNVDQLSEELEATLLKLRNTLNDWFMGHVLGFDPDQQDNLTDQISHIKTSTDIDKSIAELARHKLKIFGGTYIAWQKEWWVAEDGCHVLQYRSHLTAALNVTPEDKANSTVRVCIGWVPPQNFENELARLKGRMDRVQIDGAVVWSRPKQITFQGEQEPEEEDFQEMAEGYGLVDSNGIPT